jgi:hypothetical protein
MSPPTQSVSAPVHARMRHEEKDDVPVAMSEENHVRNFTKKNQKDDVPLAMGEVNEILSEMIKV